MAIYECLDDWCLDLMPVDVLEAGPVTVTVVNQFNFALALAIVLGIVVFVSAKFPESMSRSLETIVDKTRGGFDGGYHKRAGRLKFNLLLYLSVFPVQAIIHFIVEGRVFQWDGGPLATLVGYAWLALMIWLNIALDFGPEDDEVSGQKEVEGFW